MARKHSHPTINTAVIQRTLYVNITLIALKSTVWVNRQAAMRQDPTAVTKQNEQKTNSNQHANTQTSTHCVIPHGLCNTLISGFKLTARTHTLGSLTAQPCEKSMNTGNDFNEVSNGPHLIYTGGGF